MARTYTPADWYWLADDGRVFSSALALVVTTEDAGYLAFIGDGDKATVWPRDETGAQTLDALQEVLTPHGLSTSLVETLIAYAEAKQTAVLAALQMTHALSDGSATLDTKGDQVSITYLNSLAAWAMMNAAASPAPTRVYYNLDGSEHAVTPAEMAEFVSFFFESGMQATLAALAAVRSAIGATPPTITTTAEIDAFAWPTS